MCHKCLYSLRYQNDILESINEEIGSAGELSKMNVCQGVDAALERQAKLLHKREELRLEKKFLDKLLFQSTG
jgi:hypothetical protein